MRKKLFSRSKIIYRRSRRRRSPLREHPFVLPVLLFLLLFFSTSIGLVALNAQTVGADDSRAVRLTIDGESQTLATRAKTVGELMTRLNIEVEEHDIVEPGLDAPIEGDNFSINMFNARPVTIVDNRGLKRTLESAYQDPRQLVEKAGIKVHPEDIVERQRDELLDPDEFLREGVVAERVVINRATFVKLNLYGTNFDIRTHATTVADLLKERGVAYDSESVLPEPSSALTDEMAVFVTHPGKQIVTTEEAIPQSREFVDDPNLQRGRTELRQAGRPGKKVMVYEVMPDGSQRALQEVVVVDPIPDVFARGTKVILSANLTGSKVEWMAAAGIAENDYQYVDYIIGRESGWCPTKWQGQYGVCPSYYEELYPTTSGRGYGLCQSTPAIKMASAGGDWQTNPVTQLRWCSSYAIGRYGSWERAYLVWSVQHWW